ncbi:protein kinase [Myxococcota bacterium]
MGQRQNDAGPDMHGRRIVRQKHRRYPLAVRLLRYDNSSPTDWQSVNLSEGGSYVKGKPLLARNTELEVGLWLPGGDDDREIVTSARVAWTNGISGPAPSLPAGMGLQFLSMPAEDRGFLRDYLDSMGHELLSVDDGDIVVESDGADRSSEAVETPRGEVLGSYRITRLLGTGGMGSVFLAEHVRLGRKVALKRLHGKFTRDLSVVRRFFDEARVVNQIGHENIVEITDFVSNGPDKYFVMELLEGHDLADLLERHGGLPAPSVLRIGVQLCDALQAVHDAGVIHRDLKPENVFIVERNGRGDFVKLLDFGIAKLTENANGAKTAVGVILGTPGYIAPEQFMEGKADHRSDIYAFGVLLFEMVTGKRPFVADSWTDLLLKHASKRPPKPSKTAVAMPDGLEALILQCLAKKPARRPQHVAEIAARLRAMEAAQSNVTPPLIEVASAPTEFDLTPIGLGRPPVVRRPVWGGLIAALLVLGVMATGVIPGVSLPWQRALTSLAVGTEAVPEDPAQPGLTEIRSPAARGEAKAETEPGSAPPEAAETGSAKTASGNRPDPAAGAIGKAVSGQKLETRSVKRPKARKPTRKPKAKKPANNGFLLAVVRQLLKQKQFREAVDICNEILRLDRQNAAAYRSLGAAYAGLGVMDQACAAYRRYVRLAPDAPDRESVLGSCEQHASRGGL